jgi:hypothetical protein
VSADGPIDDKQRQLAERRLLNALRRLHRREPLKADIRVDTLVAELHASARQRPAGHRGATPLALDDAALRSVVDGLVEDGSLQRRGHRVRLAGHAPALDPLMRERVDLLLERLASSWAAPPSVEGIATRLGIPPGVIEQLRQSGELVSLGEGIDYPRVVWAEIEVRIAAIAARGPLTVGGVRDELRSTRRHAEAILRRQRGALRPAKGAHPSAGRGTLGRSGGAS